MSDLRQKRREVRQRLIEENEFPHIPEGWGVERFRFLFTESKERNGKSPVGEMLSVSEYRGVVPREYENEEQKRTDSELENYRVVRPGQLAVNSMWLNHLGLGVSEHIGHVSPAYNVYNISDRMNRRFVHHLMRSNYYLKIYLRYLYGIRPNSFQIKFNDWASIPIIVPDLATQRQIADFLDRETARIDLLIEKKQRLVEVLRAKWNAFLTHLLTKGLHERGTVSSGNRWISDIPEHWKLVRLKHFLANDGAAIKPGPFGSDLRSSDMEGDYATVINQRAVLDNDFSRKGVAVSKEKYEALRAFSVKAGDILLTSRGTIGRATIAPENVERAIIHPCVIRVRLDQRKVIPKYFLQLLKESAFLEQVLDLSNATTIEVIYGNVLGEVAFPVPPIAEQEAISIEIEKASTRTQDTEKAIIASIDRLKEYRAALITAAVTGQIDVSTYSKSGATDRRLDAIQEEMGA